MKEPSSVVRKKATALLRRIGAERAATMSGTKPFTQQKERSPYFRLVGCWLCGGKGNTAVYGESHAGERCGRMRLMEEKIGKTTP